MSAGRTRRESSAAQVVGLSGRLEQEARPEAAARVLGEYLRQLREASGLTLKDVAPVIRGSLSKLSRLERGISPPKERDVYDLVRHYNALPEQIREIDLLLQQAQANAWWHQYSDVTPSFLKRLIGLEAAASKIYAYENHVVPGLLQTPDYARVQVKAAMPGATEEEVKRRVNLRIGRQDIMCHPDRPTVVALLDEGVLLRPVGGPTVMCNQLEYLRCLSELDRVHIRIVEFERGANVAPSFPITHLQFDDGGPQEIVYVELIDSALYLTRSSVVDQYRHVLGELSGVAADRRQSMDLINEAIARYRRKASVAE